MPHHVNRQLKVSVLVALFVASLSTTGTAFQAAQGTSLSAVDGEWTFVEDRTANRPLEQLGPPMSSRFALKSEEGAIVLVYGHGSGQKDTKVKLDGTLTEALDATNGTTIRYKASWKDGVLTTETDFIRKDATTADGLIRREFRPTSEGLIVKVSTTRSPEGSVALYKHPQDIAMPTPAKATIADLSWLSGAWVGTRSSGSSIEERWSPPKGGSMLAISRTVNTSGRMNAFEFLRVSERAEGLVYIAQPGGAAPTEFICTEISATKAVFENPRHDYPNRITYELNGNALTATIGQIKGGTPRKFEFKREGG